MIDFHFTPTPNSWKVAILLEETGLPYRVVPYDIYKGEQLSSHFRAINPNLKLPAIVDHAPEDSAEPISVFESAAILIYLAEKTGRFLPAAPRLRTQALQWLIWQVAGVGPMFGQASHFIRYAPDDQPYATERYVNEANRLARVMESRLGEAAYLAGDYSIADMAAWPWFGNGPLVGLDMSAFPHIEAWLGAVGARPAVQRVFANPLTAPDPKYLKPKMVLSDEEWSNTFGANMIAASGRGTPAV